MSSQKSANFDDIEEIDFDNQLSTTWDFAKSFLGMKRRWILESLSFVLNQTINGILTPAKWFLGCVCVPIVMLIVLGLLMNIIAHIETRNKYSAPFHYTSFFLPLAFLIPLVFCCSLLLLFLFLGFVCDIVNGVSLAYEWISVLLFFYLESSGKIFFPIGWGISGVTESSILCFRSIICWGKCFWGSCLALWCCFLILAAMITPVALMGGIYSVIIGAVFMFFFGIFGIVLLLWCGIVSIPELYEGIACSLMWLRRLIMMYFYLEHTEKKHFEALKEAAECGEEDDHESPVEEEEESDEEYNSDGENLVTSVQQVVQTKKKPTLAESDSDVSSTSDDSSS